MFSIVSIIKAILYGFFIGFTASIPLGPSGLESVSRSISKGFREGFKVSLGAVSADAIYIIIINLGLFTILAKHHRFYGLFWILSGFVLVMSNIISKKSNSTPEKLSYRHASNSFLTGFFITFLNPTTPSLWLGLSGTVFTVWRHNGRMLFLISICSMIIGSITWFCFLNISVSRGLKKFKPNLANNTTKILDYFLLALGIIFIVIGIYNFIF